MLEAVGDESRRTVFSVLDDQRRRHARQPTGAPFGAWEAGVMDGIHDLGGLEGFGPVEVEPDEPVFHEDWERRTFRLSARGRDGLRYSGGAFRHSIERMDPGHYLTSSYYEHWLTGISTLIVEAGSVTADELDRRAGGRFPLSRPGPWDSAGVAGTGSERWSLRRRRPCSCPRVASTRPHACAAVRAGQAGRRRARRRCVQRARRRGAQRPIACSNRRTRCASRHVSCGARGRRRRGRPCRPLGALSRGAAMTSSRP